MYAIGDSEAISGVMMSSLLFSSSGLKHSSEAEFVKNGKIMMSSDIYHHHQQQQQQKQSCGGLMRYRSAPSSFFGSLVDGTSGSGSIGFDDYLNPQSSSPESEAMFARFMSSNRSGKSSAHDLNEISQRNPQILTSMKQEAAESAGPQPNGYATAVASKRIHETPVSSVSTVGDYPALLGNSMQVKSSDENCTNLIRQNSSPAGFFSGCGLRGDVEDLRVSSGTNGEVCSSTGRFNTHSNRTTGRSSCSRLMPRIAENGGERIETEILDSRHYEVRNGRSSVYSSGFPSGCWNGSTSTFTGLERNGQADANMLYNSNQLETQYGESRDYTPGLTHHLSLPKTSSEMATVEKYLQFQQDSIPCKIRAKRGCATHPRSIAERMRRTRISQRIKKLQDLFPNMDKQTNTADMLDLAVGHIKDLQKQVQTLVDIRSKCTCSSK